jgi:hypothetical protein
VGTIGGRRRALVGGWALVVAAVYVNQALVVVYVDAVHGGDPGFVARHLPAGWFDLPNHPFWTTLARSWPAPETLSFSVLRANALLELPFVVLGYLTVAEWLDETAARRLMRPAALWPACLLYSATFAAVELDLANPWTRGDLVLRAVSAVVTPLLVSRLYDRPAPADPAKPLDLPGLALWAAAGAGAGALVLVVYDTALLYNLAHVPGALAVAVGAAAVSVTARALSRRRRARPPGPGAAVAVLVTRRTVLFGFVPALPLRYALVYLGSLGALALVGLFLAAVVGSALRDVTRELATAPRPVRIGWVIELAVAVALAGGAAVVALSTTTSFAGHTEWRMLAAVGLAAAALVVVLAVGDGLLRHPTGSSAERVPATPAR